jgi:hypothetical protein
MKKIRDQFYLTEYHNRKKFGITGNSHNRFGTSQYNTGGFDNTVGILYFNLEGYSGHTSYLEKLVKRELFDYLIRSEKNPNKVLEYVDPKFDHVDIEYMRQVVEKLIVQHKLKIKRLKTVFLPSVQMDKDFVSKVRENPEKYLEEIA